MGCAISSARNASTVSPILQIASTDEQGTLPKERRHSTGSMMTTFSVKSEVTAAKVTSSGLDDALPMLYRLICKKWMSVDAFCDAFAFDVNSDITKAQFITGLDSLGLKDWVAEFGELAWNFLDQDGHHRLAREDLVEGFELAKRMHEERATVKCSSERKLVITDHPRFVALVAHNSMKGVLINFVISQYDYFSTIPLVTTGSTGALLNNAGLSVAKLLKSGPLGGDQEVGSMVCNNKITALFFFCDPLSSHPHQADIDALTRLCNVYQVPFATNAGTARSLLLSLKKFGLNWNEVEDEDGIVRKYKNQQAQVIATH